MATFPVKWFSSDMGNSPTLGANTPGTFISLLKAFLIDGFNTQTIGTLQYSNGSIIAAVPIDHGFLKHQVIEVTGAQQAEYNGQHRIIEVGNTWIRYSPDVVPVDLEATGTMTVKAAPVGGWSIVAEDPTTHHIALRRIAPDATDLILVIQNDGFVGDTSRTNNGNYLRVYIVEEFTDFTSFERTGSIRYWAASSRYSTEEYLFIADGHMLFWIPRFGARGHRACFLWGDIITVRPGDGSHCITNGNTATGSSYDAFWSNSSYGGSPTDFTNLGSTVNRTMARAYHQLPGAVSWSLEGIGASFAGTFTYPNPQTNGFYVSTGQLMVKESSGLRGFMPGVLQPLQNNGVYHKAIIDNLPGLENVPVLFWYANVSTSYSTVDQRLVAFRLDRWRPEVV